MSAPRPGGGRSGTARSRASAATLAAVTACALGALLLLSLVRAPAPGDGASPAAPEAGIDVRRASLVRTGDAWRLDARVDIDLPPAIRSGLDSGVPLEFVLEASLREARRFAPDRTLLEAERRYGLVYYELTRHFRVRSLHDGNARNYRSLGTALEGLGTLADVSLGPADAGDPATPGAARGEPRELVARVALRLDGRALPLPLQSPFGAAWRLPSRARTWTLPAEGVAGAIGVEDGLAGDERASLSGVRAW